MNTKCIGEDGQVHWRSKKFSSTSYQPHCVYSKENFTALGDTIDLVLLCAENHSVMESYVMGLKSIINKDTIVLIDSSFALELETLVLKFIPEAVVLSIISEVDIQILLIETKFTYEHIGEKVATTVGFTSSAKNNVIENTLKGNGASGAMLMSITEALKSGGVYPINVVMVGQRPSMNCFCWKSILSFVSFEVLSLIYGPLSGNNAIHSSIMSGVFKEIHEIAYKTCRQEVTNPKDTSKSNAFFKQLVTDFNQKHSNYQIGGEPGRNTGYTDSVLEDPFCIQTFKNEFCTYADLSLKQIINMGRDLNIECPMVECIYSFYQLISPLQREKKFDWLNKESYKGRKLLDPPKPKEPPQFEKILQNQQTSSVNSSLVSLPSTQPQMVISQEMLSQLYSTSSLLSKKPFVEVNEGKIVSGTGLNHPRFSELPQNLPNGRLVGYKQIKNAIYKSTKGTTDAQHFGRAHEFLYQYGNLNNTFEAVNNRYGGVDSLSYFKESQERGDQAQEKPTPAKVCPVKNHTAMTMTATKTLKWQAPTKK